MSCGYDSNFIAHDRTRVSLKWIRINIFRRAPQQIPLLGHVQQRLIVIKPQVVVGNRHLMERDFLGVLEEAVGPPDRVQPLHVENPILFAHVFRKPQAGVAPASSAAEKRESK